jgi:16S rRNA (uracil1498-N3)-methyltransferase
MPAERYYLTGSLREGDQIQLEGQEFHHLAHVMRSEPGDDVEIVNGEGYLGNARVKSFVKKHGVILTVNEVQFHAKPPYRLVIAQGVPRHNRLDTILEKGTELGMTDLWLIGTDRSERKELSEQQLERLRGVMIAAMKQCGRLYLPDIRYFSSLQDPGLAFEGQSYFGDLDPNAPTIQSVWQPQVKEVCLFIGPESGFSPSEVDQMRSQGVNGVKLHDNILRTDTAAIAALALSYNLLMQAD